jgi:primosomal protein N' (replication factor Y)
VTVPRTVRVLPEVSGLDKVFDYEVPARWAEAVAPGTLVRVDLHNRRVAGWVVEVDVEPPVGVTLRQVSKVSSVGPSAEVIDLARWAAHRWQGRLGTILKTASPDRMVERLPTAESGPQSLPLSVTDEVATVAAEAFDAPGVTVVRVAPGTDLYPFYEVAAGLGDAVVVVPEVDDARFYGARFRRAGGRIALAGRDWDKAASGGVVTGARRAVWSTVPNLACVVVLDEHEESLQEERNPTWHARDVAIERAARAGVPCVLVSPSPSLAALHAADRVLALSRNAERVGWPPIQVVDRRNDDPGKGGLFSSALVDVLRGEGRVVCVLNRKGRAQMLACGSCGELIRTEDGNHLMAEVDGHLVSAVTGEKRPLVCANCAGTKLKRVRLGVSRAREELGALANEAVGEITAETPHEEIERHRIVVGTEAALHRVNSATAVCFLDFDQELHAPRYRAGEEAMALIIRAARIVGRRGDGGRVLVQTRTPGHRVLAAAVRADPGRFAEEEAELRRPIGFPPFGALAEVSGKGAAALLLPLTSRPDLGGAQVMGPRADGRYLVRTDTAEGLADLMATLDRPKERVRVAIDPPRV